MGDEANIPKDLGLNYTIQQNDVETVEVIDLPGENQYQSSFTYHIVDSRSDISHSNQTNNENNIHPENCEPLTQSQIDLADLLKSWNLENIIPKCYELGVDLEALQYMKGSFKDEFLTHFDLGTKIKFKHQHTKWRYTATTRTSTISTIGSIEENSNDISLDIPENYSLNKKNTNLDLNLNKILLDSTDGKQILEYYENNHTITDGIRSMMLDIIINYLIKQDIKMSTSLADQLSSKIVTIFPSECKAIYYLENRGKSPMGKIYFKYFNTCRKLKKVGLINTEPIPENTSGGRNIRENCSDSSNQSNLDLQLNQEQMDNSLNVLGHNNCSWAEVETHWQITSAKKVNEIRNSSSTMDILLKWPHYKRPLGYKLVEIDFKNSYKNAPSIASQFDHFSDKIIPLLREKIKDEEDRKLLNIIADRELVNDNGFHAIIIHLLHYLLPPTIKEVKTSQNKKMHVRYSVKDSQKSLMLIGATAEEVEEKLQLQISNNKAIQPLLLITGSVVNPRQILVYFDGIRYQFYSILRAIDICFYIFYLFQLEYPVQSQYVWIYFQNYFYNITTNKEKRHPNIIYLMNRLKQTDK